jgi:hypothetical protein
MIKRFLPTVIFALLWCFSASAQIPPYINVPEVSGNAGQYTCLTTPTGDMRIAVIICDPYKLNSLPPPAQMFVRTHEHGHVYQIVYNPAMLYGPYAEYDADCYAATYLALTNPSVLAATVRWFETVVGPRGGDVTHGNGFQMAQRARQCASAVGVNISAIAPTQSDESLLRAGLLQTSSPRMAQSFAAPQTKIGKPKFDEIVSHGPDPSPNRGVPGLCTSLELLVDSGHQEFWEVSTFSGVLRKDVADGIGGECAIDRLRSKALCQIRPTASLPLIDLKQKIESCLPADEWVKQCNNSGCTVETFSHPNADADHPTIKLTDSDRGLLFEMILPPAKPHQHDGLKFEQK